MQKMRSMIAGSAAASTIVLAASVTLAGPAHPSGNEAQRAAQVIEKALQKHGADVHRCFEKSLADRLDIAGRVEIEVEVGPAGRVTAAKLVPRGQDLDRRGVGQSHESGLRVGTRRGTAMTSTEPARTA